MRRLLAILLTCLLLATPALAQDAPVQKWEYAHVISATQEDMVFALLTDEDEQAAIQAELDALPKDEVGTLNTLNIMGEYGWELVIYDTSQQDNGFLAFMFKRPK